MEFIQLLKLELYFLFRRKEFLFVFTISLTLMVIAFLADCYNLFQSELMDIPPANQLWVGFGNKFGQAFYMFLLPLMPVMAYADTHYLNIKTGMYKNIFPRCHKSNYILAKGVVVLASGFFVVFFPLFINQLLYLVIAPIHSSRHILNGWPAYTFYPSHTMLFEALFLSRPYLYNVLYMIMASLVGSLAALVSYAISFISNRSRLIIIATPVVVYSIYNFITLLLINKKYSLYFYLIGSGSSGLSASYFFISIVFCFIVSLAIIFLKNICNRDELY